MKDTALLQAAFNGPTKKKISLKESSYFSMAIPPSYSPPQALRLEEPQKSETFPTPTGQKTIHSQANASHRPRRNTYLHKMVLVR